jgi:hypothetical protein
MFHAKQILLVSETLFLGGAAVYRCNNNPGYGFIRRGTASYFVTTRGFASRYFVVI